MPWPCLYASLLGDLASIPVNCGIHWASPPPRLLLPHETQLRPEEPAAGLVGLHRALGAPPLGPVRAVRLPQVLTSGPVTPHSFKELGAVLGPKLAKPQKTVPRNRERLLGPKWVWLKKELGLRIFYS